MSDPVISVEGLGKSYLLGHNVKAERYTALRDVMARGARNLARTTRDMLRGRQIVQGDEVEEFWALKDVSFELRQGERLGIIGRNGAGKSTLLKLLSRITEPTEGRIRIRGRVASLLEVGTGFHPELTGRENIFLNGAILGMNRKEIQRKFDEIVDFAEVEQFLDTPVKRYSSGMYMRLAFSVAAHLEPEILIIDEVLAVGDAAFQKKCLGKMEAVGKEGRTVLFVSHQMAAVERVCQRVLLLRTGRVVKDTGDVRGVIRSYHDGGRGAESQVEWQSSEGSYRDEYFSPDYFAITNAQGDPVLMPSSNDDDLYIRVTGFSKVLARNLMIGFAVYGEEETPLFMTFHTDGEESVWPSLSKGYNTLECRFPKRLLNEGRYRFQLLTQLRGERDLLGTQMSDIVVELLISGGMSDSPLWVGRRPTILAPILNWNSLGV